MDIPKIHEGEYRFCLIMWEHEPVTAAELVKLCQEQLGWKRTTTYTVIKRLGEKGVLQNDNGTGYRVLSCPLTLILTLYRFQRAFAAIVSTGDFLNKFLHAVS